MLPFKKYIESVKPYNPGKPIDEVRRELGVSEVLKLASNENALGPSPKAIEAIKKSAAQAALYPDGGVYYLKNKLALQLGVPENNLIIGNGSNEIIEFIVKGFLDTDFEVLSSEYAFAVYPILTQAYGGKYVDVPMKDFTFDLDEMLKAISDKTRIIFIANPNNPTGTYVDCDKLEWFLKEVPKNILVCIDEAYYEFVGNEDYPNGLNYVLDGNVIVLRTFSKIYGLAGLRIGYGIASKEIIGYLNRIRQPFNVNEIAQRAAEAALDDAEHVQKTISVVNAGRNLLYEELERRKIPYVPSVTNFIMMKVGNGDKVFNQLLREGIIVRSMASYGLPEYIRVTIGTKEENEKFLQVLDTVTLHV